MVLLPWLPVSGHCDYKGVCPLLSVTTQRRRVVYLRRVKEMKLKLSKINKK